MSAPQGPPAPQPPPSGEGSYPNQPPYQGQPYGGSPYSTPAGPNQSAPAPSGYPPQAGEPRSYPPPAFVPSPKPARVTEGPEIGLPPGVAIADLGPRILAWLIEAGVPIVFGLLFSIVVNTSDSAAPPVVFGIISALVNIGWIVFLGMRYTTQAAGPGTQLMGLQLVGMTDGRPLGWGRWLLRYLLFGVLTGVQVVNIVFWVLMMLHPRRQGWHDLVVGSVLIRERALAPRPAALSASSAASPSAVGSAEAEPTVGLSTASASEPAPLPAAPLAPPPGSSPHYGPVSRSYGSAPSSASAASAVEPLPPAPPSPAPIPAPVTSGPSAPEPIPVGPAWTVRIDDREQTVAGVVLLGRNPQRGPGEEAAEIVKVKDEVRTVSKTHLALGVDEQGLYVVDRGSTNGSAVTSPDGVHRLLTAGEPVRLQPGWTVSFGQHTITVERPD